MKFSIFILFLLIISFFNCTSFLVVAQTNNSDTIPQIGLPEVVISSLRVPFKSESVPYSVSIMNARTNTSGLSLAESFSGLPGLQINTRYNYAVGDKITNRGFGARTQFGVRGIRIVYDNMPVTFADGQSNLEMIDLNNLSYIEFIRGPGSSLYGNASGGVLIIHSRDISDNQYLGSVNSTIGSNGLFRWTGEIEGKAGKSKFSADYSEFKYAGFRDHANAEYRRGSIKVIVPLSGKDILHFSAGAVKFKSLNPGSLTKQEYIEEPTIANPSSVSNQAGQDGSQAQMAATLIHKRDSTSMLKATLYGIRRSVVNPIIGKIIVLPQYSGGYTVSYNSIFILGDRKVSWSVGSESAFRSNDRKNYANNGGAKGDLTINQKELVLGSGWFGQILYPFLPRLNFDACLRYDLTYFRVNNRLANAGINSTGSRLMKALNPSAGINYKFSGELSLFTNISTSFETPTSTELVNRPDGAGGFNNELNPSRAIEYEAGFRGEINKIITYDAAFYIIHTKNELIPFEVPDAPGQVYYRNAGSTIHRGVEVTLRINPASFIDLNSSLTYTNAFYKRFETGSDDFSGNKIPGINLINLVEELKLNHRGIYISFLMHDFGKMYEDDNNSASTSKYALFDVGIGNDGVIIGKEKYLRMILSGGLSNVFDIRYVTSVTINAAAGRYYEPGPGRTVFLSLRIEMGRRRSEGEV